MKYNYLLAILVIISFSCLNAQIKKIKLPKGEETIKVKSFIPFYSIYVDRDEKIYLEKEEINLYNIAKIIAYNKSKLPEELRMKVRVHLYIDNSVNYNIVDEIKTQLASAYLYNIYYKTNSIEDKDLLKGISWKNHPSFFHVADMKTIITKKREEKNKKFNDSLNKIRKKKNSSFMLPPPLPPPNHWSVELVDRIYFDQQDVIGEITIDKNSICTKLTNKGIKLNEELIKFDDIEKLKKLFYSNDIIFISFVKDLKYYNYLKIIIFYKNLENIKRGFLLELSNEITKIHKKSKINLCH